MAKKARWEFLEGGVGPLQLRSCYIGSIEADALVANVLTSMATIVVFTGVLLPHAIARRL